VAAPAQRRSTKKPPRRCDETFERAARASGYRRIAGLDEAGRGCLFGPVYAAAVILAPERPIRGLRDSKQLSAARREELAELICERAEAWDRALRYLQRAGDAARKDKDGYIWVIGRTDDVLKVSGYRLGTAEVESALVSHEAVAEAAAIGLPHELKGNAIYTYVILRAGVDPSPALAEELRAHVGHEMGPIAKPETVEFVDSLPKTRSGKIMRRLLKARAQGLPEGDVSTLES